MKERKAYIILVIISIMLSGAVYTANRVQQTRNEHKFCDILSFSIVGPVPSKPADPKDHPSRERAYEGYQKIIKLKKDLGCP